MGGFLDSAVASKPELYDVWVDAKKGEVRTSATGKHLVLPPSLVSVVKDALKQGASSMEGGEKPLVDALAAKTAELIAADAASSDPEWSDFLSRLQQAEAIGAAA